VIADVSKVAAGVIALLVVGVVAAKGLSLF